MRHRRPTSFRTIRIMLILGGFLFLSHPAGAEDIVRQTRVLRGSDQIEHIFLKDGQKIAEQVVGNDQEPLARINIPNGKVTFTDSYHHSYGEENYTSGLRHGKTRTYFEDGRLMKEAEYLYGMLLWEKEYYHNGGLRFDINYSDARDPEGARETGVGKLYYSNGQLKFEWDLTRSHPVGFKKTYNRQGRLMYEAYFDENGNLTRESDYRHHDLGAL